MISNRVGGRGDEGKEWGDYCAPLPLFCSQNSVKEVQKVDRVLS